MHKNSCRFLMASKKKAWIKHINQNELSQNHIVSKLGTSQGTAPKTLKRIRDHDCEGNLKSKKKWGGSLKVSPNTATRINRIYKMTSEFSVRILYRNSLSEKVSPRMARHQLCKNLHFKAVEPDQNPLLSFKYLVDSLRYFLHKIRHSYFYISCINCNKFSSVGEVVAAISKREWWNSGMDLDRPDRLTLFSSDRLQSFGIITIVRIELLAIQQIVFVSIIWTTSECFHLTASIV